MSWIRACFEIRPWFGLWRHMKFESKMGFFDSSLAFALPDFCSWSNEKSIHPYNTSDWNTYKRKPWFREKIPTLSKEAYLPRAFPTHDASESGRRGARFYCPGVFMMLPWTLSSLRVMQVVAYFRWWVHASDRRLVAGGLQFSKIEKTRENRKNVPKKVSRRQNRVKNVPRETFLTRFCKNVSRFCKNVSRRTLNDGLNTPFNEARLCFLAFCMD
jgi:hypothetical protein